MLSGLEERKKAWYLFVIANATFYLIPIKIGMILELKLFFNNII